jgi:ABC-type branched-subunit amino acid transport system ATPase component/ABC-type branched-subunit amino acid transport system permease subunit
VIRVTRRGLIRAALVAAGLWVAVVVVFPQIDTGKTQSRHLEAPAPVLLLGITIGMTYGLLAVGLLLIYRTNRIVNFAHGQIGAFGAAVFGIAVMRWDVPYWAAFLPSLAIAGGAGAVAEAVVVRRLRSAPAVMSVVATLGVGQVLVLFAFAIGSTSSGATYPQPAGLPELHFGALLITPSYFGMLVLSPVVVILIGLLLKLSWFGIGIRSSAANTDAARMAGIPAPRMSSLAWALSGALAAFAAILTFPTQGLANSGSFGPSLLLVALTSAVLARMQSLPVALGAGCAIGVLEQLVLWNYTEAGLVQPVLLCIIVGSLVLQRQRVGRTEDKGSWTTVQSIRPLPASIARVTAVRLLRPAVLLAGLAVALCVPLLTTNATATKLTGTMGFIIVGLSVVIITGLAGQLSLGQFAFAGIGAVVSFEVARRSGSYVQAFAYAGFVSAAVSVALGIPALRIRGLLLAVTTLSFALSMSSHFLQQDWLLGAGREVGRPIVNGYELTSGRSYYFVGLATLVVALWLASNVRSGGIGRRLVAVRDNEDAARAFTVPAGAVKVQGFALAGFLAGVGGAMYGHAQSILSPQAFPVEASIDVVVMTVIGGVGLLSGPFLGAAIVQGATYLPLDSAGLTASSLGQLLILMYLPGGIGALVAPVRDRLASALARRAGVDVEASYAEERGFDGPATAREQLVPLRRHRRRRARSHTPLLAATGVGKAFGGIQAVRGVDLVVWPGETVGLIGPNGAGKTTTFELLAGFTRADGGRVRFAGRDITHLRPEARARLGLIRSFQDAALFPTLTVMECIELALERVQPTRFVGSVLGFRRAERERRQRAEELLSWMGLERYRASQVQELSTGTRRIAELACLVALEPEVLLLDEPSSGVAQRETEALAELLDRLKVELGMALVVIEHDIPMVMGISDRIVCMADGEVISEGRPDEVRTDPRVVEAYLGLDDAAIARSDHRSRSSSSTSRKEKSTR